MRHTLLFIFLLVVGWWPVAAIAANFCPFQPGATYQYSQTGSDSLYTMRLNRTGYLQASDSAYHFNFRMGPYLGTVNASCRNYRYSDNLFGGVLEIGGAGTMQPEYRLVFGDVWPNYPYFDMFAFRPRAPLNQPWPATANGYMGRVTARGIATVLGQADSVVTITIAGVGVFRLSKNYGLVEGPSLRDFVFRQPSRRRQLTLSALPGRRLGRAELTPQAIYDFQPGEVFWYNTYSRDASMPTNNGYYYNYNYLDSVMTRTASRTGDTLTYRVWRCAPTQQMAGTSYTLIVSSRQPEILSHSTGEYVPAYRQRGLGGVLRDGVRAPQWNNRATWRHDERYWWPLGGAGALDSTCVNPAFIDGRRWTIYAAGLGITNVTEENTSCCFVVTTLLAYRKGTERWGTPFQLVCRPLAAASSRPASTTAAFPNPFSAELAVSFTLARPQAVGVVLRDALGRVVLERAALPQPAGAQQLLLATAGLPAGIYTAHLHFAGEGRTEVLKVLKAE